MNFKRIAAGVMAAAAVITVSTQAIGSSSPLFADTAITAEAAINDIAIYYSGDIYACNNIQFKLNKTTKKATIYGKTPKNPSGGNVTLTDVVIPGHIRVLSGDYQGTYEVAAVNNRAFYNSELTSIDLSNCYALTDIKQEAFRSCKKLKSVKLNSSISSIAYGSFQDCTALSSFDFNGAYRLTTINSSLFLRDTALKNIDIPYGVRWINSSAFNSSGLTSIKIPNSVTSIGLSAFAGCKSMKKIDFEAGGNGTLTLDRYAFANCTALNEVRFNRRGIKAYSLTFNGCGDSFKSYGYGAQDYTQSVAKDLLGIWGLKYDAKASAAKQKEFFNSLQKKLNDYITYQGLEGSEEGCAATVISIRKGTCGGFARVFYNFCIAAGVNKSNVLVGGDRHCHAWNYVKVGNLWYNIDATNDVNVCTKKYYSDFMIRNWGDPSYYEAACNRTVRPHHPEDFIVCIDDVLGSDDAKNFNNIKTDFFDKLLSEGAAGSVQISGTRA